MKMYLHIRIELSKVIALHTAGCHRKHYQAASQAVNKKLRYREDHSASVVLSWCTL